MLRLTVVKNYTQKIEISLHPVNLRVINSGSGTLFNIAPLCLQYLKFGGFRGLIALISSVALCVRNRQVWPTTLEICIFWRSANDDASGYLRGVYVLLKSAGTVVWPIPVRLRTSCHVDITYFPFDDQFCSLLFGSSIYSHNRLDYIVSLD